MWTLPIDGLICPALFRFGLGQGRSKWLHSGDARGTISDRHLAWLIFALNSVVESLCYTPSVVGVCLAPIMVSRRVLHYPNPFVFKEGGLAG